MSQIELEGGKYTYINDEQGQRALRYGEHWRDLAGDKFVYCLAAEIESLRAENEALKQQVEQGKRDAVPEGLIECVARAIYMQWRDADGYLPWQDGGNSLMQDSARRIAAAAIAATPKQE